MSCHMRLQVQTCTQNGATGGGYATQRKEVGGSEMGQNIERRNLRQRGVQRGAKSEPETGSRSTVGSGDLTLERPGIETTEGQRGQGRRAGSGQKVGRKREKGDVMRGESNQPFDTIKREDCAIRLLLTTVLPGYGSFSSLVHVKSRAGLLHDISLGLEWGSFLRESLILSGYRPGNMLVLRLTPPSKQPLNLPSISLPAVVLLLTPTLRLLPFLSRLLVVALPLIRCEHISNSSPAFKAMLHRHHVSGVDELSVTQARYVLLSHLISGSCIGVCDAINHSMHACRCAQFRSAYGSEHAMAFDALSILLSASPERLPSTHMFSVIQCLGLPSTSSDSREAFLTEIGLRRSTIIEIHASANPAHVLFEYVLKLPEGSLVSLAQSHGLNLCKPDSKTLLNLADLRTIIWQHLGTGQCTHMESHASYLGCSSVSSQLSAGSTLFEDRDDPPARMQVDILNQLGPVLKIRPLRRLLDLHDVAYAESDKAKKLRQKLKSLFYQLVTGKPSSKHPPGTKRGDGARAEENSAHSAGEDSDDSQSDASYDPMEVDEEYKPRPWLDDRCLEPPMPRDNLPYSSLLVEPDCIVKDADANEAAIISVVVADVDGNAPSNQLRSAALKHIV
ncbi:hypothetical protein B0H13DRAFT_2431842 [Mycena leptocephala]|nr:hypothetical protein B0H13DRAFT_2431842 [Mycena leptocephala]